jgi:hypothetical protein
VLAPVGRRQNRIARYAMRVVYYLQPLPLAHSVVRLESRRWYQHRRLSLYKIGPIIRIIEIMSSVILWFWASFSFLCGIRFRRCPVNHPEAAKLFSFYVAVAEQITHM